MGVSPDPLLHHEGPRTHPSCVCSLCQEHQDPVISSSHRAGARLLRWKSRASRTNQALNRSFSHHDREWTHRDSGASLISRRKSPRELRFIWTLSWRASSPSPSLVWRSMAFTLGLVTTMLTTFRTWLTQSCVRTISLRVRLVPCLCSQDCMVEGILSSLDHWMIFLTLSFPSSRESSMLRLLLPTLLGTSCPLFGSELL